MTARVFSLCFGFPSGGTLLLGDVALPPGLRLAYTPLLRSSTPYYAVTMASIDLGGTPLPVQQVGREGNSAAQQEGSCRLHRARHTVVCGLRAEPPHNAAL